MLEFCCILCTFYDISPLQPVLADLFELDTTAVHALVSFPPSPTQHLLLMSSDLQVSKMIITEELMASLDQPSQCIVMHRSEPSRLQSIALQLSDKVGISPLSCTVKKFIFYCR